MLIYLESIINLRNIDHHTPIKFECGSHKIIVSPQEKHQDLVRIWVMYILN